MLGCWSKHFEGSMPDHSGYLTPDDHEKIQNWWDGRWKAPVICPVCKTTSWAIGNHVVNAPRYAADAFAPGTGSYPFVVVACQMCMHTMFFNAAGIGVVSTHERRPLQPPSDGEDGSAMLPY
jgi:hypothetical protein